MEIDCSFTEEIVCPHCGYEFQMSHEIFYDPNDDFFRGLQCNECKKQFDVYRHITESYSSCIPNEKYERS